MIDSFAFLTPLAALAGLAAVVPLAALVLASRRSARIAAALGLRPVPARWVVTGVAIGALGLLVAVAAAQPVAEHESERSVRQDAEALFVVDVSRSMLAARSPEDATRFVRARRAAVELRRELGDVPAGVASLTDRVIPHLFPSPERDSFDATVTRALAVDTPPPVEQASGRSTSLAALSTVPRHGFFSPGVRRRLVVVLTDAETRPFDARATARVFGEPYRLLLVRIGNPGERVWGPDGAPESYVADPASVAPAIQLAEEAGGAVFREGDRESAAEAAREFLGGGPTVAQGSERRPVSLAPWVLAVGILPLGLLLWRRPLGA
ncbi:MAG: hypothetical protein ABR583_05270 [Gaiellaceae bacterium]